MSKSMAVVVTINAMITLRIIVSFNSVRGLLLDSSTPWVGFLAQVTLAALAKLPDARQPLSVT